MPRTARTIQNESLLVAALEGLQLQKQRIEAQIHTLWMANFSPRAPLS